MTTVQVALIATALAGAPGDLPLELHATPRASRVLAGEGIVLDLDVTARVALWMESIPLNLDRTAVTIRRGNAEDAADTWTGRDHLRRFGRDLMAGLGRRFHAERGATWTEPLALLDYAPPLAAGRYSIEVAYRVGDALDAPVSSGRTELTVEPADLTYSFHHWTREGATRDRLESLWSASDEGRTRWFYQVAAPGEVPVIRSSTEFIAPGLEPHHRPALARLDAPADLTFERWVVWADSTRVGWMPVHSEGAAGPHRFAEPPGPRRGPLTLIGAPYHTATGVQALFVLADAAGEHRALHVSLGIDGVARWRPVPGWRADAGWAAGLALWSSEGPARALMARALPDRDRCEISAIDLESGRATRRWALDGRLLALSGVDATEPPYALLRGPDGITIVTGLDAPDTGGAAFIETFVPCGADVQWLSASSAGGGALAPAVALLVRQEGQLRVAGRSGEWSAPVDDAASERLSLLSGPSGLLLVRHRAEIGFVFERIPTPSH